jgi:hypothetical protein
MRPANLPSHGPLVRGGPSSNGQQRSGQLSSGQLTSGQSRRKPLSGRDLTIAARAEANATQQAGACVSACVFVFVRGVCLSSTTSVCVCLRV